MRYKDLSWPLKVGVTGGWISLILYAVSFITGFISGFFV